MQLIYRKPLSAKNVQMNTYIAKCNTVILLHKKKGRREIKRPKYEKNVNLLKRERPYNRGTLDVGIFEQSVYVRQ